MKNVSFILGNKNIQIFWPTQLITLINPEAKIKQKSTKERNKNQGKRLYTHFTEKETEKTDITQGYPDLADNWDGTA